MGVSGSLISPFMVVCGGGLFSVLVLCGGVLSLKLARIELQLLFPEISVVKDGENKKEDTDSCLCSSCKKSKMKKKVRFAPDVVDPDLSCKNKEYRRRQIINLAKGRKVICSSEAKSNKPDQYMIPSGTKPVKFQNLAKPASLPANRAALYDSMLQYRNQIRDKGKYR